MDAMATAAALDGKNTASNAKTAPMRKQADGKGAAPAGLSVMTPSAQPVTGFHVIYSGQVEAVDASEATNCVCFCIRLRGGIDIYICVCVCPSTQTSITCIADMRSRMAPIGACFM